MSGIESMVSSNGEDVSQAFIALIPTLISDLCNSLHSLCNVLHFKEDHLCINKTIKLNSL